MHEIYELKDMLCKELEEYGRKGDLDVGSLEIVDKLAHAVKNLGKIIEMKEESEGYSSRYMYDDGYNRGGTSYRNRSYARGRNTRRDSMGRYSRAEDGVEEMVEELRDMMGDLPEEKRKEVERFINKMERM